MRRRGASIVLSWVMSVMLVIGSIPLPAYAEAMGEAAAGGQVTGADLAAGTSEDSSSEEDSTVSEAETPETNDDTSDESSPEESIALLEVDTPELPATETDAPEVVAPEAADSEADDSEADTPAVTAVPEAKAETPSFDQAQTVGGVRVAVKAGEGVFPAGARLNVELAPREKSEQANLAQRALATYRSAV